MWLVILTSLVALLLYLKLKKIYNYWEDKGVPFAKPWLIFGNMGANVFRTRSFTDMTEDLYKLYPDKRYIGIYQFVQPTLMLRDPELIKQITVKDFDTFPDHRAFVSGDADPLWSKNLFSMTGKDGWHDMRATLSPSFTSSKMRTMYTLMEQCSKQFVNHFKNQSDIITVEIKDVFTRFTNDVIATTAFGVSCDSLKDRDNQFYLMGKDATNFSGLRSLKFFGYTLSPTLMKLFNVKIFSIEVSTFFRGLIKDTLRVREEKQIVRPDMIHLLMEARKGRLKYDNQKDIIDTGFAVVEESEIGKTQKKQKAEITDDDITAQALIFFLAGFDTASTLMCYVAYELAVNPFIQERLREEVDSVAHNEPITYEALLGMKYLDNIISETLRLHPPAQIMDRKSIKPYTIQSERPGEKTIHLDKDSLIWIPVWAIHMDPKNYPDPTKFDPERFSDENKQSIKPYSYLPFGAGPRNCIGSRFALLECKLIIVELLRSFQIVTVEKTQIPIQLSKANPNPLPDGGIWLGLKKVK